MKRFLMGACLVAVLSCLVALIIPGTESNVEAMLTHGGGKSNVMTEAVKLGLFGDGYGR